jgi:hypothetical protein
MRRNSTRFEHVNNDNDVCRPDRSVDRSLQRLDRVIDFTTNAINKASVLLLGPVIGDPVYSQPQENKLGTKWSAKVSLKKVSTIQCYK